MESFDLEDLLVPLDLEPPYALFVGDILPWKDVDQPSAQFLMARSTVTLQEILDFVGAGATMFHGRVGGEDVAVWAKLPGPGMRLGRNMIATWLLDGDSGFFVGPVVICQGVDVR